MESNFYVADVFHVNKLFKYNSYSEKLVLYSKDNINYVDLISGNSYTTCSDNDDYIIYNSIIPTDVSLYRIDYMYMLDRYNENYVKRKINTNF